MITSSNMSPDIVIDGENLTFEQVVAVAYGQPGEPRVVISETAKANVQRAADAVQAAVVGHADREAGRLVATSSLFRLASLTKPLVSVVLRSCTSPLSQVR